jgi:hypothetical protein
MGYSNQGGTCVLTGSSNECQGGNTCGTAACGANTTCNDPNSTCGNRTCTCLPGYSGNPLTGCTDIDECSGNPCVNGTCTQNSPGQGYSCSCGSFISVDSTANSVNDPVCVCDMTGTFAVRIATTLSWSNITNIENASGVVTYGWGIRRQSYDSSGNFSVTTTTCGGTTPDICGNGASGIIGPEAYAQFVTNQAWASSQMQSTTLPSMTLARPYAGQAYNEPQSAQLLGISLTNPLGTWPASRQNVQGGTGTRTNGAAWKDDDNDGIAGVTSFAVPAAGMPINNNTPPSCTSNADCTAACGANAALHCAGTGQSNGAPDICALNNACVIESPPYAYATTSPDCPRGGGTKLTYAYWPGLEGLTVRRVNKFYLASRVISQFQGTFTDCNNISGSVIGPKSGQPQLDGRIYGCGDDSPDGACAATILDNATAGFDSTPQTQQVTAASFVLKRLSNDKNFAVTCDHVRATDLPCTGLTGCR